MTNKQYKILKYINAHNDTQSVCDRFNTDYQSLQNMLPANSLTFNSNCSKVYLTDCATSDVEARHRDAVRHWLPIIGADILSLAAIIISIIALRQ